MSPTKYPFFSNANTIAKPPKESMKELYQEAINNQFYNSTSWAEIDIEGTLGSETYSKLDVRLTTVMGENGNKLSDDFRKVIFKNPTESKGLGYKLLFGNSTWLTINYDIYGKPTASTIVRKCRNILKWINKNNGAVLQEPCVFDAYGESGNKPITNKNISLPDGTSLVIVQNNSKTSLIDYNQRFYLNGFAYKVISIFKALNEETGGVAPLIYLVLNRDSNDTSRDDIVNGIANIGEYVHTIEILGGNFEQVVGYTATLLCEVTCNGEVVTRDVVWSSSDEDIVSVSSSGVILCKEIGDAEISVSILGNPLVEDSISISVKETITAHYEIRLSVDNLVILQGDTLSIGVYSYNNNVQTANAFTCVASGLSSSYYSLSKVNDNLYSVMNIRQSSTPLNLRFTDVVTNQYIDVQVILKGVF